jgi:hypothetical protein
MEFTKNDIDYITNHGLTIEEVNRQIEILKSGMKFVELLRPATIDDGIIELTVDKKLYYKNKLKKINISIQLQNLYLLQVLLHVCLRLYISI